MRLFGEVVNIAVLYTTTFIQIWYISQMPSEPNSAIIKNVGYSFF